MARVEERNNLNGTKSWRVSIRKKGFREVCKTFKTKEAAQEFSNLIENSMDDVRNKKVGDFPSVPLSVFIDRYRSEVLPTKPYGAKELVYLRFWEKALGNEIAIQISPSQIELHANSLYNLKGRMGNNLGPETRRKYIAHLSIVYSTAIKKWKWCIYNPLTGVDHHRDKITESRETPKEENLSFVDEFKKTFCFHVHDIMNKKGLNQRQAAKNANMTLHTLQFAIDPKNNTTIKNLLKVAKSLGIRIEITCD